MAARSLIAGWFDADTKARFAAVAQSQGLSESALLRRLVDAVLINSSGPAIPVIEPVRPPPASGRLSVRVADDDLVLLRERAKARELAVSSYVTFVLKAHLSALAPLPTAELNVLRSSVLEIAAIGRNLNQIARVMNSGAKTAGPGVAELHALVLAITRLRAEFHSALEANRRSWSTRV